MNRLMLTILFACSLIAGSLTMTGCNTFAGMGADTKETADVVQVGPREAYHQDARDF